MTVDTNVLFNIILGINSMKVILRLTINISSMDTSKWHTNASIITELPSISSLLVTLVFTNGSVLILQNILGNTTN